MMNRVKTASEIEAMRASGKILGEVLRILASETKPGISTQQLSDIAARETKRLGGGTPTLGFENYPAPICISVNDEVVHAIPGPKVLKEGDIVSFDHCVSYGGMITDAAITVPVGEITPQAKRLLRATIEARDAGIAAVREGVHIEDISKAIQKRLRKDKLGIVEALCGHGVGHSIHEDPEIPNFDTGYPGIEIQAGMTLAIEPMATLGTKRVTMDHDGWTFRTSDGSLAAQFEHTILVTEHGSEILTA